MRVLVFPHIGAYSTPQKREKVLDRVTLSSKGECVSSTEPTFTTTTKVPSEKEYRAGQFTGPLYIQCTRAVTIVRDSDLKSYSYDGNFRIESLELASGVPYVRVINLLPFEKYLKGVIAAEMPASWPFEALKVQAVAARTYGTYEVLLARHYNPHRDYDIDDTVQFQAYLGLDGGTAATNRAVEATDDERVFHRGQVVKAYFSADSGGYTESAEAMWGDALAYCLSKREEYDPKLIKTDWQVSFKLSEVRQKLLAAGRMRQDNPVVDFRVRPEHRSESGRVRLLAMKLRDGTEDLIGGEDFRYIFKMKSTLFNLDLKGRPTDPDLVIDGKGFGHGVGMSQWGAKVLVESEQWDYRRILNFYYEATEVKKGAGDEG